MIRRPLSPNFDPNEQKRLLEAMGNARHLALLCASAARQDAVRYQKCHALTETIDALAENLTGDRIYFHLKAHGGPR